MVIQIDRVYSNLRLGITFRKLKDLSVSKLSSSVRAIELERDMPFVGEKKRVIRDFDVEKEGNEYHISSVVDVPIKIKDLIIEDEKIKINERTEYIPTNIETIIRLRSKMVVLFSQNQKAVRRFSKYIKEITLKGFKFTPLKFAPESMRKLIEYFIEINHLKVIRSENGKIKSIAIKGENLLGNEIVSTILSKDYFTVSEVGGFASFFDYGTTHFYINRRGRACIYGDLDTLTLDSIYNLILKIENIMSMEELQKGRGD